MLKCFLRHNLIILAPAQEPNTDLSDITFILDGVQEMVHTVLRNPKISRGFTPKDVDLTKISVEFIPDRLKLKEHVVRMFDERGVAPASESFYLFRVPLSHLPKFFGKKQDPYQSWSQNKPLRQKLTECIKSRL